VIQVAIIRPVLWASQLRMRAKPLRATGVRFFLWCSPGPPYMPQKRFSRWPGGEIWALKTKTVHHVCNTVVLDNPHQL
jgi:hypothetical protein